MNRAVPFITAAVLAGVSAWGQAVGNAGFEQGQHGEPPAVWEIAPEQAAVCDNAESHEGVQSLRVKSARGRATVVAQSVTVPSGKEHTLQLWLKTVGLRGGGVTLVLRGADDKELAASEAPSRTGGAWSPAWLTFKAAADVARIEVRVEGPGQAWLDQAALRPGGPVFKPTAPAKVVENDVALGKRYWYAPATNYRHCTDEGDATQLTDGAFSEGYFWTQKSTVGWAGARGVAIILDLGQVQPVSAVKINMAGGGRAGVCFPQYVEILTSVDGTSFARIGREDKAGLTENGPVGTWYLHKFGVDGVNVLARYVLLAIKPDKSFAFADEIEVVAGREGAAAPTADVDPADYLGAFVHGLTAPAGPVDFAVGTPRLTMLVNLARAEKGLASLADLDPAAHAELRTGLASLRRKIEPRAEVSPKDFKEYDATLRGLFARAYSKGFGERQYVVWTGNPAQQIRPGDRPEAGAPDVERLSLTMLANEYEPAVVNLTNLTPQGFTARIVLKPLSRVGDGKPATVPGPLPQGFVKLRGAAPVKSRSGLVFGDALPELGNGQLLRVPALATGQLWVTFDARQLDPGDYELPVEIYPLHDFAKKTVIVSLHVAAAKLSGEQPLNVYNWSYLTWAEIKDQPEAAVRDLFDHYVNTIVIHPSYIPWPKADEQGNVTSIDFSAFDRVVGLHKGARWLLIWPALESRATLNVKHIKFRSPEWHVLFVQWYHQLANHLLELGYDNKHWAFYPVDEPSGGKKADTFSTVIQVAKEARPDILIYADATTYDLETLERWKPFVDIWCPNSVGLTQNPALIDWYRQRRAEGDQVWSYACHGPGKLRPPHGYYRMQAWLALDRGQNGIGHWAYADVGWGPKGNAWDDFDPPGPDFSVVYRGAERPVPSRRWEQFRQGVEDYWLVTSLRAACDRAREAKRGPADEARSLCDQAVRAVVDNPDDASTIPGFRARLITAYEQLIEGR